MKKIVLILISFLIFSCSSRNKNLNIDQIKTDENVAVSSAENVFEKTTEEAKTDLTKFLKESNLKINSKGQAYQLQINGLSFSGDADIEFSNSEQKTSYTKIYKVQKTYSKHKTYNTRYLIKTTTYKKVLDVETKKDSFWLYVLISFTSITFGILSWEYLKRKFKFFTT